jgi:hypothetical protein
MTVPATRHFRTMIFLDKGQFRQVKINRIRCDEDHFLEEEGEQKRRSRVGQNFLTILPDLRC